MRAQTHLDRPRPPGLETNLNSPFIYIHLHRSFTTKSMPMNDFRPVYIIYGVGYPGVPPPI